MRGLGSWVPSCLFLVDLAEGGGGLLLARLPSLMVCDGGLWIGIYSSQTLLILALQYSGIVFQLVTETTGTGQGISLKVVSARESGLMKTM